MAKATPHLQQISSHAKPSTIPPALIRAINTVEEQTLRSTLKTVLEQNPSLVGQLSKLWLVQGRDVVRYHVDSADEDGDATDASEEEAVEDEEENDARDVQVKLIATKDEEMTPRFTKCENCSEQFDVTVNFRGACNWHPGNKEIYEDDDFWADHDENCHGLIRDFEDDPDMAEGFMWDCCQKLGDDEGCKVTKHKAPVNEILSEPAEPAANPRKRASEEVSERSVRRRV